VRSHLPKFKYAFDESFPFASHLRSNLPIAFRTSSHQHSRLSYPQGRYTLESNTYLNSFAAMSNYSAPSHPPNVTQSTIRTTKTIELLVFHNAAWYGSLCIALALLSICALLAGLTLAVCGLNCTVLQLRTATGTPRQRYYFDTFILAKTLILVVDSRLLLLPDSRKDILGCCVSSIFFDRSFRGQDVRKSAWENILDAKVTIVQSSSSCFCDTAQPFISGPRYLCPILGIWLDCQSFDRSLWSPC
jgi:hypothetical protein